MVVYEPYEMVADVALLDELAAAGFGGVVGEAGLPRLRVLRGEGRTLVAVGEGEDAAAVASVVNAHDPAAYAQSRDAAEAQDATDRAQVRQVLAALDAGTLTPAQVQKALARLVRVLVRRGVL